MAAGAATKIIKYMRNAQNWLSKNHQSLHHKATQIRNYLMNPEIRRAISDTPIVDVTELIHSSFDTRTPFTLEFQGHERGKTVYFCLIIP
jgi:hypothetical protein